MYVTGVVTVDVIFRFCVRYMEMCVRYRGHYIEVLCPLSWSLYRGLVYVTMVIIWRCCARYRGRYMEVACMLL